MKDTTTLYEKFRDLPPSERKYASTVIPIWLSFTIYMLIGIPIL